MMSYWRRFFESVHHVYVSAGVLPPVTALPFDRMWDDGRHWLPRVLAGERLRATFSYAPDRETVAESAITPLD